MCRVCVCVCVCVPLTVADPPSALASCAGVPRRRLFLQGALPLSLSLSYTHSTLSRSHLLAHSLSDLISQSLTFTCSLTHLLIHSRNVSRTRAPSQDARLFDHSFDLNSTAVICHFCHPPSRSTNISRLFDHSFDLNSTAIICHFCRSRWGWGEDGEDYPILTSRFLNTDRE